MSAPRELFDSLDAIDKCVDRGAWELACNCMQAHDAMVRKVFAESRPEDSAEWRELLARHRELTMKISALRADAADQLGDLRRQRTAFREYLDPATR